MVEPNWSRYPNFTRAEFQCKCGCGEALMSSTFVDSLQYLRDRCRFPLIVSSGYRCPDHNDNVSRTGREGPHTTGMACDILISGPRAYTVLAHAMDMGFPGVGVNQRGKHESRFIHLDLLSNSSQHPRPRVWGY